MIVADVSHIPFEGNFIPANIHYIIGRNIEEKTVMLLLRGYFLFDLMILKMIRLGNQLGVKWAFFSWFDVAVSDGVYFCRIWHKIENVS